MIAVAEACSAVSTGIFKGVPLSNCAVKDVEINKGQFYQALVDAVSSRLLGDSDRNLCETVSVIDAKSWPPLNESPEFGESELRQLCSKFSISFPEVKNGYREFKDCDGKFIPDSLRPVFNCVNTLPVSTAECERGFSLMNILCTPLRSRISVTHMSSVMFISLNGPSLNEWNPGPYVKSWLAKSRRDATSLACMHRSVHEVSSGKESFHRILSESL